MFLWPWHQSKNFKPDSQILPKPTCPQPREGQQVLTAAGPVQARREGVEEEFFEYCLMYKDTVQDLSVSKEIRALGYPEGWTLFKTYKVQRKSGNTLNKINILPPRLKPNNNQRHHF